MGPQPFWLLRRLFSLGFARTKHPPQPFTFPTGTTASVGTQLSPTVAKASFSHCSFMFSVCRAVPNLGLGAGGWGQLGGGGGRWRPRGLCHGPLHLRCSRFKDVEMGYLGEVQCRARPQGDAAMLWGHDHGQAGGTRTQDVRLSLVKPGDPNKGQQRRREPSGEAGWRRAEMDGAGRK